MTGTGSAITTTVINRDGVARDYKAAAAAARPPPFGRRFILGARPSSVSWWARSVGGGGGVYFRTVGAGASPEQYNVGRFRVSSEIRTSAVKTIGSCASLFTRREFYRPTRRYPPHDESRVSKCTSSHSARVTNERTRAAHRPGLI